MVVWVSLIAFILFLKIFFPDFSDKKVQRNFLIISGIAVALIMALRYPYYEVVYDLSSYYEIFGKIGKASWDRIFDVTRFEKGYVIFNKLLYTIFPWKQAIFFAEAIFSVFCVCRFIYKNSDEPFMAMLFFITLGTMEFFLTAFRQAFAIGICLLSVEKIKKQQFFKFLLIVSLACTFHKSAIIFFCAYFFLNRKITLINNLVSIIFIAIASNFAIEITEMGNEFLDYDYHGYQGNDFGGIVPIIIYLVTIIISFANNHHLKSKQGLNMTVMGLGIYTMRYATLILERVSFFFTTGTIIALPDAINSLVGSEKNNLRFDTASYKIIRVVACSLAIVLFIYRATSADYGEYRFFWQI